MQKIIQKIALALGSRTFWTVVVMFLLNTIALIPNPWKDLVNAILTFMVTYFHLNPSQNYSTPAPSNTPQA